MKNILMVVLIMALSVTVYAKEDISKMKISDTEVIQIETTALVANQDGSFFSVGGTIVGLTAAPKGEYQMMITNGKNFQGETYSEMKCQIMPLQEIKYAKSIPLSTSFVVRGDLYQTMGFFSGSEAFPEEGYVVTVTNGKSRAEWNTLKCKVN